MNLNVLYDSSYIEKLDSLFHIYEINPIFPFEDYGINPSQLVDEDGYDSTPIYKFLKEVKFVYYFDQKYIGYIKINSVVYIIDIDTELNISIIGDNLINWTRDLFYIYQKDDQYEDFKSFCLEHYSIQDSEPDYDKFSLLQDQYLTF